MQVSILFRYLPVTFDLSSHDATALSLVVMGKYWIFNKFVDMKFHVKLKLKWCLTLEMWNKLRTFAGNTFAINCNNDDSFWCLMQNARLCTFHGVSFYIYNVIDAFAREFSIFLTLRQLSWMEMMKIQFNGCRMKKLFPLLLLSSQRNSIVWIMQYKSSRESIVRRKNRVERQNFSNFIFDFHLIIVLVASTWLEKQAEITDTIGGRRGLGGKIDEKLKLKMEYKKISVWARIFRAF